MKTESVKEIQIKNLSDCVPEIDSKEKMIFTFIALVCIVIYFGLAIVFYGEHTLVTALIGNFFGGVLIYKALRLYSKLKRETLKVYSQYLDSMSVNLLVQFLNSEEFDYQSKRFIKSYLDTNHKGWSLNT